jgi:predicted phosphodiesterase
MPNGDIISFIHLSDIHFNKYAGDPYDIDKDLRNEISQDIVKNAKQELSNIKGIFVCGDIAAAGQSHEYSNASKFLSQICRGIEIPESLVFTVPGNHDVDQDIYKNSPTLLGIQKAIEDSSSTSDSIDNTIANYARDKAAKDILYKHLTYYNEFEIQFNCNIGVGFPTWGIDIPFNGFILHIHGMNSTLISSHLDHAKENSERLMIIGRGQVPKRQERTINISLCHHPPDCWKDPNEDTIKLMNQRCQIQLYGHKHISTVYKNGEALTIGSGAMQPPRSEHGWFPSYNWITLEIMQNNGRFSLKVKIYPRKYCCETFKVISNSSECNDGMSYSEYILPLNQSEDVCDKSSNEVVSDRGNFMAIRSESDSDIKKFVSLKTLVYNYMNLSFISRMKILLNLDLIENKNDIKSFDDTKMLDEIFGKIINNNLVDKFNQEINNINK